MEQTGEISNWRRQQRARLLELRSRLDPSERASIEASVLGQLQTVLGTFSPQLLGFYWPIKGELDCLPLVKAMLADGWQAAVPIINDNTRCLDFCSWLPDMPMQAGTWNIPVPVQQHIVQPQLFLVPLVGFDQGNYRLGYGGGYYDRTLASLTTSYTTIGIGMEAGRFDTIFPHEFDIAMDMIVTEAGIQTR